MKSVFFLAPLLLVSCVNLSGKLDAVGRRVAVYDPDKTAAARYEVGGKYYVPITVRRCESVEKWLTLPDEGLPARRGIPEPHGEEWSIAVEEGTDGSTLLTEEELKQRQARVLPAEAMKQGHVFANRPGRIYWEDDQHRHRLLYVGSDIIPDKRSLGNQLRRPLCWALTVGDGALSVAMATGEVLLSPIAVPILVAAADTGQYQQPQAVKRGAERGRLQETIMKR